MPSTATITAFYSFTANTKARASQVNGNFSLFRGHLIPIDPNTQTAISNTYDLGSSEYKWRTGYFRSIDLTSNTTTGNALSLEGETTSSNPAFVFKIAGTKYGRIAKYNGHTTAADYGGVAVSAAISAAINGDMGVDYTLTQSQISLSTDGRPVDLSLITSPATTSAYFQIACAASSGDYLNYTWKFYVNGSLSGAYQTQMQLTATAMNTTRLFRVPFNARHRAYPAAGSHSFYVVFSMSNMGATSPSQFLGGALTANEI